LVLDCRGPALREQQRAVELAQFLLGEAAHHVGHVDLPRTLARPTLEAVGVEEPHEELKVSVIAAVRGRSHQQEMARPATDQLTEPIPFRVFDLRAEEAR
jgi:hypothetical protein